MFIRYFVVDIEIMQEYIGGMELNQLTIAILELIATILELTTATILKLTIAKYRKSTTI